jgi:thioredoxin-related protein
MSNTNLLPEDVASVNAMQFLLLDSDHVYLFKKDFSLAQLMAKVVSNKKSLRKYIKAQQKYYVNFDRSNATWYVTDTEWYPVKENLSDKELLEFLGVA